MEHRVKAYEQQLRSDTGDHQLGTLTQLLQAVTTMRHVDEMFLWMTSKMVQHLKIEVAQIWTTDIAPLEQVPPVLRATSVHDQSIHTRVVTGTHIMKAVAAILGERRSVSIQPVGNLFSQYQSSLLGRYGLNYCICSVTSSNMTIPSIRGSQASGKKTTPSIVAALAFLTHSRPQNSLLALDQILEQSLLIAQRQGLLQTSPTLDPITPDPNAQQHFLLSLYEVIPVRTRPHDSMRSSSPFASSPPIPDKRAMTFLSAIDGSKSVTEIAIQKKLDGKDVIASLHILLQQERIQLYTKDGKLVDSKTFLSII